MNVNLFRKSNARKLLVALFSAGIASVLALSVPSSAVADEPQQLAMMGMMFGHSDSHSGTGDGDHQDHEGQREESRTIFGGGTTTLGLYGAPYLHLTKVGSKSATIIGGEMAAIIDGSLILGMSGGSLVGQIPLPQTVLINGTNETVNLRMNYMGFLVGYCAFSTSPVHFCLSSVIGSGQVDYTSRQVTSQYYNGGMMSGDRFLTLVPAVDLELNLTRWARATIGVKYRYYTDFSGLLGFAASDVNGLSYGLGLKFGWL